MFTLEQKVDIILRYISTTDKTLRAELKKAVVQALESDATSANNTPNVEGMIADVFKYIGMPPHIVGYKYAMYAIQLCVEDGSYSREITKRLYPAIAAKFGTTPSRVERGIRHAVEVAFDRGDFDAIVRTFGNTISVSKGKLTNGEFIAACTLDINRKLKGI